MSKEAGIGSSDDEAVDGLSDAHETTKEDEEEAWSEAETKMVKQAKELDEKGNEEDMQGDNRNEGYKIKEEWMSDVATK